MPIAVIEQVAGVCLLTLILLDIFVTVLYARAGSGLIAPHVGRVLWRLIRRLSMVGGRSRDRMLSFGGPLLLVGVLVMWFVGLSLGAALVIHPVLGSGVKATGGKTPTTFTAALLAGGSSVSIVGSGGFEPSTDTFRVFCWLTSIARTAVTSLELTYLMQVYTNGSGGVRAAARRLGGASEEPRPLSWLHARADRRQHVSPPAHEKD